MSNIQAQPKNVSELNRSILLGKIWFMIAWITIIIVLLIIPLEDYGQLSMVRQSGNILLRLFIYGAVFLFSITILYFVGKKLDYDPYKGKFFVILGLVLSSVGVILFLQNQELILLVLGFWLIGIGSSLVGGVGIYVLAGFVPVRKRGFHISHPIGFGSLFILIVSFIRFFVNPQDIFTFFLFSGEIDDFIILFALLIVQLVALSTTILLSWKYQVGWINTRWPTSDNDIIKRRPVKLSFIGHFLIFIVFGIAVSIILDIVRIYTFQDSITVWLQVYGNDFVDLFWCTLFLGNFIAIWIFGRLADKFGRKTLAIIGVYTISLALLGFSVSLTLLSLIIAALAIGIGVSGLNVTLDTSMWIDLSPRDGLGRYTAIGLISLITGLSFGRLFGVEIISLISDTVVSISLLGYIMLFVTALAVYPLTQIDDTFPPLNFLLLLVRMKGGVMLYSNKFQKDIYKLENLPLVSGGLEAIDSFMHEVLQHGNMEHVLHAGYYILNEQIENVRANLVTNKANRELRELLTRFTVQFNDQYREIIDNWTGNLDVFTSVDELVEQIFGPLITSPDLETSS
ncbi:MAG: hypothetical protein ACXAC8_02325 [Candidatus Hodarchaeales archaeon]